MGQQGIEGRKTCSSRRCIQRAIERATEDESGQTPNQIWGEDRCRLPDRWPGDDLRGRSRAGCTRRSGLHRLRRGPGVHPQADQDRRRPRRRTRRPRPGPAARCWATGPNQLPTRRCRTVCAPSTARATTWSPGQENFGAADQPFPRLTTPVFRAPSRSPRATSRRSCRARPRTRRRRGNVIDSQPRSSAT